MAWEVISRGQVAALSGLNESEIRDEWYDWVIAIVREETPYEYFGVTATITGETHDGDGTNLLVVRYPPIVSVSSLSISDSAVTSTYYKIYDHYVLLTQTDENILNPVFPVGTQNISITYVSGFQNTPGDLIFAIANAIEIIALHKLRGASVADLRFDTAEESAGTPQYGVPVSSLQATVRRIIRASGRKRINFR